MTPIDVGLARPFLKEPEIADLLDLRVAFRKSQTFAAFSPARLMRSSSVSRLRSSIQAVLGSQMVPMVFRSMRIWLISPRSPTTAPATKSLCPPIYLVML